MVDGTTAATVDGTAVTACGATEAAAAVVAVAQGAPVAEAVTVAETALDAMTAATGEAATTETGTVVEGGTRGTETAAGGIRGIGLLAGTTEGEEGTGTVIPTEAAGIETVGGVDVAGTAVAVAETRDGERN